MPSARTIVSYRPTPEEEGLLEALAKKMGMSKSRTLAFALRRVAEQEKVTPLSIAPSPLEMQAIQELYDQLPAAYWQRRHELEARQRNAPLVEAEHAELMEMIERAEEWNVRRLTYLFDLARRHNVPHDYFLDSLGIRHHPLSVKAQ